jgi:hypothetical protein
VTMCPSKNSLIGEFSLFFRLDFQLVYLKVSKFSNLWWTYLHFKGSFTENVSIFNERFVSLNLVEFFLYLVN